MKVKVIEDGTKHTNYERERVNFIKVKLEKVSLW